MKKWKIKKINLGDYSLPSWNPRNITKTELNKLKMSIEKFGYVQPIVVNERTKRVVGGNQRARALRELGINEVEAVVIDLPSEEEKALNLALNKISGEWDPEKLYEVLSELTEFGLEDFTGFDWKELEELDIFEREFNKLLVQHEEENQRNRGQPTKKRSVIQVDEFGDEAKNNYVTDENEHLEENVDFAANLRKLRQKADTIKFTLEVDVEIYELFLKLTSDLKMTGSLSERFMKLIDWIWSELK